LPVIDIDRALTLHKFRLKDERDKRYDREDKNYGRNSILFDRCSNVTISHALWKFIELRDIADVNGRLAIDGGQAILSFDLRVSDEISVSCPREIIINNCPNSEA
jgi:hypothetical protein